MKGKIYRRMDFSGCLGLGSREALEVYNQYLWSSGDGDFLRSFALTFALRALPNFVAAQFLFLAIAAETVIDIAFALSRNFNADGVESFVGC